MFILFFHLGEVLYNRSDQKWVQIAYINMFDRLTYVLFHTILPRKALLPATTILFISIQQFIFGPSGAVCTEKYKAGRHSPDGHFIGLGKRGLYTWNGSQGLPWANPKSVCCVRTIPSLGKRGGTVCSAWGWVRPWPNHHLGRCDAGGQPQVLRNTAAGWLEDTLWS